MARLSLAGIHRLLFGIGDLNRGRYFAQVSDSGGSDWPMGIVHTAGYKYGISNTSPNYSQAVYSRKSYGQFRDLIEMRNYSANLINNDVIFTVDQSFVTRNGQPLSSAQAGDTRCSNISPHASSSIPFFDRENSAASTNRDAITVGTANISPSFAPGKGPFVRKSGF